MTDPMTDPHPRLSFPAPAGPVPRPHEYLRCTVSETCIDAVYESESTLSGRDSNMAPILNLSIGHWAGFCAFVLGALALDRGLFHRQGRRGSFA